MTRRGASIAVGATIGLVSAAVAIGVAQLVAGIVNPHASPILVVGQSVIDATPEWLKAFAIRAFGDRDKTVLLAGIGAVLVALAVVLGTASLRRAWVGIVGLAVLGLIGVVAALTRSTARAVDALPTIAAAAAGAMTLTILLTGAGRDVEPNDAGGGRIDRRRFLLTGLAGIVAAVAAGGVGRAMAGRFRADESRALVNIPEPASRAAALAAGTELKVAGLRPFFTPNDHFYRVDTAVLVPALMAEDWRLRVHGMVDRELTLDYEQLLARPLTERDITLTCVSNPIGGSYVDNARWLGAPLRDLLEEAGPRPGADQIVSRSIDGFTIGTPTAVAMDGRDAMLAVAMNGEPLPVEHGFPVRMIVPGLYGYVSATKWLVDVELTTFEAYDPYWIERGWAERGPVKTMSRIDTPTPSAELRAGEIPIAGVAWAQHVGIDRVDVSIDGAWRPAELAVEDSIDTWRQWVYRWDAMPGEHRLKVRATDRMGATQSSARSEPFPDGATGHHEIVVRVA